MSLSHNLQSPDILKTLPGMQPATLRALLIDKTRQWHHDHPAEATAIAGNLKRFGLSAGKPMVAQVCEHIALHYFEKLLPLCGAPAFFRSFINEFVDCDDAVEAVVEAQMQGKAILLTAAHFGGVELIVPALASQGFSVSAALRFQSAQFSQKARAHADLLAQSKLFGAISFIEVGKEGTAAALDMAAVIRKRGILLTVFDEKTDYCVAVKLFGVPMWGGAGLDKLIAFGKQDVVVFAAFMIREPANRYRLILQPVETEEANPVQQMYDHLQQMITLHAEQWYFLHEEIPFIAENG
jgi:lauroyl/myristoyl acyltransferase